MALENMDLKTKRLVSLRRGENREREKREEEKRKKKKRRREGVEIKPSKPKVWKLTLIMNPMRFGMDLWLCRIIIFPKLGVLLGFHLNPKIMESKVGKNPTWHKMVMESFL